jgi:hypothetical protein
VKAAGTGAVLGLRLAPIVTGAEFMAVRICPGLEMGSIASHLQVIQVD